MGFKCVPQILGLIRGTPSPGQRHRANIKAILSEPGQERHTNSATYDPSRSDLNIYEGYESGFACADDMIRRADEYVQEVHSKSKTGEEVIYTRNLRSDAVIGWGVIMNPPDEMTAGWTFEDYEKFDKDAWDALCQIEPRLFRDENVRMTAWHFDEGVPKPFERPEDTGIKKNSAEYLKAMGSNIPGGHTHRYGDSVDENGRYCGNLITRKLYEKVNTKFAAIMREKGWDLDDPDVTDWGKFYEKDENGNYKNEEYREERKQVLKKSGRTNAQYVYDKAVKSADQASEMLDAAIELANEAGERLFEADARDADKERVIAEKEKAESELQALNQKLTDGQRILSKQAGKYRQKQSESEQLDSWITAKRSELKEVQDDKAAAERAADEAEKRKRVADEGSQQFLEFLTGALKRVSGEDATEEQTLEELQYALEREFQIWEDSLDAQKQAHEEREKKLEQAEVVKSPSSAADFLLGLVKDSKQYKGDADMVRTISLLQNLLKFNRKDYDAQYEKHIEQIRQRREGIKRSESPIMSHTGREGLDFEP